MPLIQEMSILAASETPRDSERFSFTESPDFRNADVLGRHLK